MLALNVWAQPKADAATVKQLISKNAVALGLTADDVTNIRVSSSYYDARANVIMAYLQQTYNGVDVYQAVSPVAFRDDNLVTFTSSRISEVDKLISNSNSKPSVAALTAIRNAASDIQSPIAQAIAIPLRQTSDGQEFEYDKMGIGFSNIIARLMWVPVSANDNKLQLAWLVSINTIQSNDLWSIKVDALTGKVINKENLTVNETFEAKNLRKLSCYDPVAQFFGEKSVTGIEAVNSAKYNVIPYPLQDPNYGNFQLVTNPWTISTNTNATTLKWQNDGTKDYDSTKGNNVYSSQNPDSLDITFHAAKSSTALPDLTFDFTPDFLSDPLEDPNTTNAAVTNLFYWNNLNHDLSYAYGFDEASGNFQASNQGRGGKEKDFVKADAQDGSGQGTNINNANFSAPTDGQSGRMQMYLWSSSLLKILEYNAPESMKGYTPATESAFSINNKISSVGQLTQDVVLFNDFADSTQHNGCGLAENAAALKGKIAYINRRGCDDAHNTFVIKVKNAQIAGAIGCIVGNILTAVDSSGLITMSGTDNTITIPAVFISTDDANTLKTTLNAKTTVNATFHAAPKLDGDFDNGIISHEFYHGVSGRLTGGASKIFGCLSNGEQMGEGWSDYNALMMTTDWSVAKTTDGTLPSPIGNYAKGLTPEYGGIRTYPYSTDLTIDPWTYGDLKTQKITEVHTVGEVWCSMIWDMTWEIIKTAGINKTFFDATKPGGNSIANALVIQGLKLQPCSPGFVDGRNAILKADTLLYGGSHSLAIWTAFARRGLGFSASEGKSTSSIDGTAAFDLPLALPAIFGNFTAEKVNITAVLKWTTVTEINVDRFVVERTVDGRNYTEVGAVKATGNSTRVQSYTFTDLKPVKGTNIYRIRLVDRDNKSNYSDAKSLVFSDIKNLISLAPNPARDKVVLTVKENRKPLQVKLFNNLGEQVASFTLSGESMPIDISRFTTGAYYISITGEGINQKEKLIIQ